MKVLHVYRCYYPCQFGGLQEAIRQIALTTKPLGVESRIFALSTQPDPALIHSEEGDIVRSRSWLSPMSCDIGGPDAYRKFCELADWADVIHYQFPWPFADLLQLIYKPQKPTLITYQSDIVGKGLAGIIWKPWAMHMLCSMNRIIATSPQYRDSSPILSHPDLSGKVQVIPLAISESSYNKTINNTAFDGTTVDTDKPYVLFIGAFRRYKGLSNLLQAAQWVNGQIVLLGSGLLDAELRAEASKLGINNVLFLGSQPHATKVAFLSKARAVVLPSNLRSEAFGMALIEGLMFSKPLVCCDISTGTRYVNIHGETGFVVPPNQPHKLAEALNALLLNEELAAKMGVAARNRYETHFSGSKMAEAYLTVYQQLLNRFD